MKCPPCRKAKGRRWSHADCRGDSYRHGCTCLACGHGRPSQSQTEAMAPFLLEVAPLTRQRAYMSP